jgi:hypothetical protein
MPNYEKVILCLANSRKISGRCVAGREITAAGLGSWIRPVSARDHGELSELDRRFQNGTDPRLLDIVRIPLLRPHPITFQTENHVINDDAYWTLEGRGSWVRALAAVDGSDRPLWANESSSYNGEHDRVSEVAASPADGSLRLLDVQDLEVLVVVEGAEFNNAKRRVRGRFVHGDVRHCLSITDPIVERRFLAQPDGTYPVGRAMLCISLGEPWQGWAYKLIAGIILPD